MEKVLVESGSSMGVFMDCPKKYEYQYVKRLSPRGYSSALGYGSLVHSFVECYHKDASASECAVSFLSTNHADARVWFDDAIERVSNSSSGELEKQLNEYPIDFHEEINANAALAFSTFSLWAAHWGSWGGDLSNDQMIVLSSEKEWEFEIDGNIYCGKSDGWFNHMKYGDMLYELKTSGSTNREGYKHQLQLNKQVSANLIAMNVNGLKPKGVIYDIMWKPLLRRKTERKTMDDETLVELSFRKYNEIKENRQKYFERTIVFKPERELDEFRRDLRAQFNSLRCVGSDVFYRNTNACENYGGLCPYFNACMDEDVGDLELQFKVRPNKFPELERKA